jgi:hypothetical protein
MAGKSLMEVNRCRGGAAAACPAAACNAASCIAAGPYSTWPLHQFSSHCTGQSSSNRAHLRTDGVTACQV